MSKIAVVTDSNSGITNQQAEAWGIFNLSMPFTIDGQDYYEGINLTQEEFYQKLEDGADISTSQPTVGHILDLWDRLLEDYDEIVHIPMSSGLSGACETAKGLALDYDGRVEVVDNHRISVTQRQSVLDAMELVRQGQTAAQIREFLEAAAQESSIYITVDTLKYLKKGGRITATAAAIGTVLNLKPVLQIQGEKLDAYSKCRGMKQAKKTMLDAMDKDLNTRFAKAFAEKRVHLAVAYTYNKDMAQQWKEELEERYPGFDFHMDPLSLSVSCHIGPGALAVACSVDLLPEK